MIYGIKDVIYLSTDIENFSNGIDVDETVDSLAGGKDEEKVRNFFMKAENANFIVPYKDNENIIPLFNGKDGLKLIPLFASYTAFEKSPLPKEKAKIMHFDKINDIVKNSGGSIDGMIINPHGKSMVFRHSGSAGQPKKENPGIRFMKPVFVPEKVAEALKKYFSECSNVYSAYILWAQKEGELTPHLFLLVDFDGKKEEFLPKVAENIKTAVQAGAKIEMAKADFKLLKVAEKLIKPIYKKT